MVSQLVTEVIFVGLPGPTHHYSGLSPDNVASSLNRGSVSNPKQAALQALDLVRLLRRLGIVAGILPPQLRPHLPLLRQHFSGDDASVIAQAALAAPALLEKSCSAAAMWTANAATVSPGIDGSDGNLHITPANLFTNLHRRIEAEDTYRTLAAIFTSAPHAIVHPPLSAAAGLRDEGAANHMRLTPSHSEPGLNIFVYGADGSARDPESARQTLSASQALAAHHHIPSAQALFVRQNPDVIRQGVFHNDVIAVSNEYVLLVHEEAFTECDDIEKIERAYRALHPNHRLHIIRISPQQLSVEEAVYSYFFNSQIVTTPDGMALIAPLEVELLYEGKGLALMKSICADAGNPITQVHTVDLRQSMRNGGGPACLRLRVPMAAAQLQAVREHVRVIAGDDMLGEVEAMIHAYYPEQLMPQDLGDPALYAISRTVLEKLSAIMKLPLLG